MIERETMDSEDNDPDTLQLKDELDTEWVKRWHNATNKKRSAPNEITINVILPKKKPQRVSKHQSTNK